MTATTRRAALTALASASALALPAVAPITSPDADAEILALAAEIERLCSLGEEIYAKGVDPFQETFQSLLDDAVPAIRRDLAAWEEHFSKAWAYSRDVGREAAIKEREELDEQADLLWKQMMAIRRPPTPERSQKRPVLAPR
jgi:hypothetical protein